jgi:hypothetical protein
MIESPHPPRRRARMAGVIATSLIAAAIGCATPTMNGSGTAPAPLVIQEQGSFAVGGCAAITPTPSIRSP